MRCVETTNHWRIPAAAQRSTTPAKRTGRGRRACGASGTSNEPGPGIFSPEMRSALLNCSNDSIRGFSSPASIERPIHLRYVCRVRSRGKELATPVESRADDPLKVTTDLWDKTAEARAIQPVQGWMDSAVVLESYVQPRITGDARTNWLIVLGARLQSPRTGRWLSLGCGAAGQEIFAAVHGLFGSMDAFDASPQSIEQAKQAAEQQGIQQITFASADLNHIRLPERT